MIKIALIGAGQRGNIYGEFVHGSAIAEIVSVVEPDSKRRNLAAGFYGLDQKDVYTNTEEFFKSGKIADAIILANMDRDHYADAISALDLEYDILLEKPISPEMKEVLQIQQKAEEKGCKVIVCHVLRYTEFFREIKKIVESGELGKIISITHSENIGNFHMAHSFVRGNWSKASESSPLILQKSSHDMDILTWLIDSEAKIISSFGDLNYFKEENAPQNSSTRCLDCNVRENCTFNAYKVYLPLAGIWPATVLTDNQTEEGIIEAIRTGPYGRCVFRCDNDVCDSQVALIKFKNGVTVTFNLSAFSNRMCRTIKIMCEKGEIIGDDGINQIEVIKFTSNSMDTCVKRVVYPKIVNGFHGGGDTGLMVDFLKELGNKSGAGDSRSSIKKSVESHVMSHAAEVSRLSGKSIDVDEFKREIFISTAKV